MSNFLQQLPEELENQVLEYTGKMKLRNGKYINQIPKDDPRYDILRTIPHKKGKVCMMYNQMCYISLVIKNERCIISYMENHPNHPEGEISISYVGMNQLYPHILGNKFPPCFVPSLDNNNKKRWKEYYDD